MPPPDDRGDRARARGEGHRHASHDVAVRIPHDGRDLRELTDLDLRRTGAERDRATAANGAMAVTTALADTPPSDAGDDRDTTGLDAR